MNMELHFNQEAPSIEEGKGHFATGYTINYLLGKLHLFTRLIVKEKNYTSHLLVHTNPEIKCYLFASLFVLVTVSVHAVQADLKQNPPVSAS